MVGKKAFQLFNVLQREVETRPVLAYYTVDDVDARAVPISCQDPLQIGRLDILLSLDHKRLDRSHLIAVGKIPCRPSSRQVRHEGREGARFTHAAIGNE